MGEQGFSVDRSAPAVASAEATIPAGPDAVWAVLSDIDAWPSWNASVKQARLEGQLAPGSAFIWKAGPGIIRSVLAVVEPPRRIGWTGKTMGINAVHVWEIEPDGDGCRVRTEESWDGLMVRVLKPVMRGQLQKAMDSGLAYLVAELKRREELGEKDG